MLLLKIFLLWIIFERNTIGEYYQYALLEQEKLLLRIEFPTLRYVVLHVHPKIPNQ